MAPRARHSGSRIDANQPEIVDELRGLGCTVTSLASVGRGCPDLLIGIGGINLLAEVKDGNKPPSKRKLTDDEWEWHADWRGQVCVVESREDARRLVLEYGKEQQKG